MKKNIDDNSLEELKFLLQFTIEVIDSNENDIDKALILYKFYKSPEDFNKLFLPFKIKLENKYPDLGFRIDEIDEILRNFKSNQIYRKINNAIQKDFNIDYYFESKNIITEYINNPDNLNIILKKYDLKEGNLIERALYIKKFSPIIFSKYKIVRNEKLEKQALDKISFISFEIINGCIDESPYDIISFFKEIPFKYSKSDIYLFDEDRLYGKNENFIVNCFYSRISEFMRKNNIESRKIIEEYMKKNNIYSLENYSYEKFLNSYFLPMKYIIEGKEYLFGQEDAKIILDYMIKNDLPFFTRVFSELQLRYLKQEIDFNDENDKTKLK